MPARKRKKELHKKPCFICGEPASDETFAFIAGYTSNGYVYGLTHEDMEALSAKSEDTPEKPHH